jgi:hypothetical protein
MGIESLVVRRASHIGATKEKLRENKTPNSQRMKKLAGGIIHYYNDWAPVKS